MKVIKYKFCDGRTCEIEVDDEFAEICHSIEKEQNLNDRRETRRHISFDHEEKQGRQFEADARIESPLYILLNNEEKARLHKAISELLPQQRELIKKVFFDNIKASAIADSEGVDKSAVSHRLERIYEKLKKLLN